MLVHHHHQQKQQPSHLRNYNHNRLSALSLETLSTNRRETQAKYSHTNVQDESHVNRTILPIESQDEVLLSKIIPDKSQCEVVSKYIDQSKDSIQLVQIPKSKCTIESLPSDQQKRCLETALYQNSNHEPNVSNNKSFVSIPETGITAPLRLSAKNNQPNTTPLEGVVNVGKDNNSGSVSCAPKNPHPARCGMNACDPTNIALTSHLHAYGLDAESLSKLVQYTGYTSQEQLINYLAASAATGGDHYELLKSSRRVGELTHDSHIQNNVQPSERENPFLEKISSPASQRLTSNSKSCVTNELSPSETANALDLYRSVGNAQLSCSTPTYIFGNLIPSEIVKKETKFIPQERHQSKQGGTSSPSIKVSPSLYASSALSSERTKADSSPNVSYGSSSPFHILSEGNKTLSKQRHGDIHGRQHSPSAKSFIQEQDHQKKQEQQRLQYQQYGQPKKFDHNIKDKKVRQEKTKESRGKSPQSGVSVVHPKQEALDYSQLVYQQNIEFIAELQKQQLHQRQSEALLSRCETSHHQTITTLNNSSRDYNNKQNVNILAKAPSTMAAQNHHLHLHQQQQQQLHLQQQQQQNLVNWANSLLLAPVSGGGSSSPTILTPPVPKREDIRIPKKERHPSSPGTFIKFIIR